MKITTDILRATFFVCGCCLLIQSAANAQSSRDRSRKDDSPSARTLEMRLAKAEEALVNEYRDVAVEFYSQGEKEKAMAMLRRLKQLNPDMEGLGDRIASIEEELLQENANEIEIDTRMPWTPVGDVLEEKTFRIQAAGEFKLTFNATIGPDGLKPDAESKDYLPGAPLGCLLGAIVTEGKPGKPFPVKSQLEHTPKKGGTLFLKVNVPEGSRCLGKIKVRVSGYISSGK
ncbi:MAG: hypothetical protein RIK87_25240 [Fuerstiella sp.]